MLVVGAGPAGAAAAAWAARLGRDVVLADAATFPRDKPCGDGLTPRAIAELDRLGLGDWVRARGINRGLRAAGFGELLELPWPGGSLPDHGGAVPRLELDARIRDAALKAGAIGLDGAKAVDVQRAGNRVTGVRFELADGASEPWPASGWWSPTVPAPRWAGCSADAGTGTPPFGVAARGYVRSGRSDDEWISSHLELRGVADEVLAGYGWVFPLADGEVNIGVGTLATARRPANVRLRALIEHYAAARRADWQLDGPVRAPSSALLPMGGAVSGVAGPNWALIGDAAGCVNPLNGEGIDYGLETGRLVAELIAADRELGAAWPATLRHHYGEAFSIARRLAGLLTLPRLLPLAGPLGMRSRGLMTVALRVMGNLVTAGGPRPDRPAVARRGPLLDRLRRPPAVRRGRVAGGLRGAEQTEPLGPQHGRHPVGDPELGVHPLQVFAHRALGQEQPAGGGRGGEPVREQPQHGQLPRSQPDGLRALQRPVRRRATEPPHRLHLAVQPGEQPVQPPGQPHLTRPEARGPTHHEAPAALRAEVHRQCQLARNAPGAADLPPCALQPAVGYPVRDVTDLDGHLLGRGQVVAQQRVPGRGPGQRPVADLGPPPVELLVERPQPLRRPRARRPHVEGRADQFERALQLCRDAPVGQLGERCRHEIGDEVEPFGLCRASHHVRGPPPG